MTLVVSLAIRSAVMLATGLLISAGLRNRSAALRHRVLVAALLAAALVVPFSFAVPALGLSLPSALISPRPTARPSPSELLLNVPEQRATAANNPQPVPGLSRVTPATGLNGPQIIVMVWLAGTLVTAAVLIASLLRVRQASRLGVRVVDAEWLDALETIAKAHGVHRTVVISRTHSSDLLGTWGIVTPEVLLPPESSDWSMDRVRVVLSHEIAHIRRHDWFVQIGADAIRTLLWFNPLAWVVCRRLRHESERACDDEVLAMGVEAREYAVNLLALARQCRRPGASWASAIPMAHPSTLEARITAMLNPLLDRRVPSQRALFALALGAVLMTLPVAALRAKQVPPAPLLGTVYDVTGGVIPGAEVALIDATNTKWTATSKVNGRFELPAIGAGKYVLEVKLQGFRALRQEFELKDARDWDRAVTLQIGTVTETVSISASRATLPAPVTASPSETERIRVGGNIRVPKKEVHVAPTYPPAMIAAGLSGVVPIEAVIGVDGTVTSVRVLSAQVHPDFAIAAADAVRQWRFTPTLLNRVPVEVSIAVTVRFELKD